MECLVLNLAIGWDKSCFSGLRPGAVSCSGTFNSADGAGEKFIEDGHGVLYHFGDGGRH